MRMSISSIRPFRKFAVVQLIGIIALALAAHVHAQCANPANAIVAENCLTGNPSSEWDIPTGDAGDLSIQGFSTDISVTPGNTISFKINTVASAYTINIYRIGYYQGNGARKVATITPSARLPQQQPACISDSTTGLTDCGNWNISASWAVPTTAVSGVYVAHLVRSDTGGNSHIVFVVRNDTSHSAILYQTSDPTWVAYNYYGNGSLYGPGQPVFGLSARTFAVSYNRPALTRGFNNESATWFFGAEFAMVQWLEQNGYDVSYFTGLDADRNGALIKNHKVYMDSGHDEYVSPGARANVQAARDAGVNLAFFSGNEFFWKTRWANSSDGSNTPYRTLICYKESLAFAKIDPQDPPTWTGTWRDPTFSPPGDGGLPENALTGTLFTVNGTGDDNDGSLKIKVPQADGQMRFWRNTAAARLASGATYTAVEGSLGYEWDEDIDNGFRPAGAFQLSTTSQTLTTDLLLDYGATYGAGTATHHMMMYRAPSGALVFGAGTVDWAYGLNSNHDQSFEFVPPDPDVTMQQATVNLFADMGVQPASLQAGLSLAAASTDVTAPHSVIVTPTTGASLNAGSTVTVTGTATDTGGVVGGVEFSPDGGVTWHPAIGRGNWSYSWTPTTTGSVTVLSRAVDDSGNLEKPTNGVVLTVAPQTCPCTIFESRAPTNADSKDGNAIEVGVKFRADSDGSIVGVRFYKAAANTGAHVGHVWTESGTLLGTATFSGESASGWQQANFSQPIPATANTIYVVSYFAPNGHYSDDSYFFEQTGADNPPLHALQNGVDGGNGLFVYSSAGGFPTSTLYAGNYWADVIYTSSNTYAISGNISGDGGPGATVTLAGPESLTTAADASGNFTFNGVVNGNYTVSVANAGVTFTPPSQAVTINFGSVTGVNFTANVTNPLSISGTISGGAGATVNLGGRATATTTADNSGNYSFGGLLGGSYTITPSEPGLIFTPSTQNVTLASTNAAGVNFTAQVCDCISIWPPTAVPDTIDSGDAKSIEVGVLFRADSTAYLTGLRFYKASTNTGTHVGHLWSQSGQLLGTVTFPGETASGWQQGYFSTPVLINAGTPYVASYFAPNGHYSATGNYFASAGVDNSPLHALQSTSAGLNGVYVYASTGTFPNASFQATNYWVDVLYAAQPYSISGSITGPGSAGATVTLSNGGTTTITTTADSSGNYTFNGVFAGSYTITPSAANAIFLPGSQNVTLSQSNITGVNFSIPALCPCNTLWQPSIAPGLADSGDTQSVEVGTKMRVDNDGYILGVRFYKAATNLGPHVGNLWSETNTASPLATATFVNEGASGWQQVLFSSPVPVSAATTYIASYFAPMGHYAADGAYFANAGVDSPPIHGLATGVDGPNAVFAYGASSSYPSNSYNADNYWVDLIYAKASVYTIAGTISGPGGPGATVTLSGASAATTTADGNGNYSFTALANGAYTVQPSLSGFTYSAPSQNVTINNAHSLGVNFSSTAATYSIAGTVSGGPGITVNLTGATSLSTTADSSGNYSFPSVPKGTYTVTPAGAGFTVTPTNQNVTVNGNPVSNVNFTASALSYSISGTITGGAGATVSLVGSNTVTTTADASGNYSFSGVFVGNYMVMPSKTGLVFNPANISAAVANANITGANFTVPANCPCDTLWTATAAPTTVDAGDSNSVELGVKFTADADAYVTGIRFYKAGANVGTHQGNLWSTDGTLLATATFQNESANGWQQVFFSSPIPVKAGVVYIASYFAPSGHYSADMGYFSNSGVDTPPLHAPQNTVTGANGLFAYTSMSGFPNQDNGNAMNYWVDVIYTPTSTYSIGGNISGAGGPGTSLALSGDSTATVVADNDGSFVFSGLANGSYTITPSASGVTYAPVSQSATINSAHALGLNFVATGGGFTISGTISGVGGPATTVTLTGPANSTTSADGTGFFSFTGLANGSYVVAVSNSGYSFTPASQPVTVHGANVTANFSSASQTYAINGTLTGPGANGATVILSGTASATTTSSGGAFSFPGLANGSYTVAVSNPGYVFTPANQAVTVNGGNATISFSSVAQTYTISGTISGAGGNAAIVTLSGTSAATTVAGASGAYSFSGLANGSYTVAVSKTGYTFTPISQPVTVNGANMAANFSSAAQTYTITGTITGPGASGATVTLSGAASATTTSSAGTFSFAGLANGSYTVAVSNPSYIYTPASQAVTVNGANGAVSFSSVAKTFTLTGTISGAGGNAATVRLTGAATATATTNSTGVYTFSGLVAGSYSVTPTKTGFLFSPGTQSVTITTANVTANFTSGASRTLSGTISGAGGNGATVTLTGAASATTTATSAGVYSFTVLNGSYTVTPTNTGYIFTPANRAVTVNGANVTANFTSAAQTYTISGTVSGASVSGVTVRLTGTSTATTTTSTSGTYSFTGVTNGSYTVTPSKTGFIYNPTSQSVTVAGANATANFTSTATFTISGTISGTGGNGATVTLGGASSATTTASTTGAYSFTVTNGSYSVTPSKAGFTFTPVNRAVTVNGANVTASFTSAALTFTISGTITGAGASGATVRLTGAATATTTTNTSGTYSFTGVTIGSYTVTPSKTGFLFSPTSQSVVITSANGTANFASSATHTISGTISGLGGIGTTVTLSGAASASTTTNILGSYSFTVADGVYTVTPTRSGYAFTPANRAVTVSGANVTANFSSALRTASLSDPRRETFTSQTALMQHATGEGTDLYDFMLPRRTKVPSSKPEEFPVLMSQPAMAAYRRQQNSLST